MIYDYAYEHHLRTTQPPLSEGGIVMLLEQHRKYKREYEAMQRLDATPPKADN